MKSYLLAAAFCLFGGGAMAQSAVFAPAGPNEPPKVFATPAEIQALIAKAKVDRKGDAPQTNERLLTLPPYRAQVEYRPATAPAALHETEAELMFVVSGTGTLVTGGTLIDGKRLNPANQQGTGIAGGTSEPIVPGSMAFVPENTPHQVMPAAGQTIVLITMHVPRPLRQAQ